MNDYVEPWQGLASDHRRVPVEVLREFARSQAERTSVRVVADDAGVGRSTVHKFITAGTMPHPRVRRLLGVWYLRRLAGVDELELIRPYSLALATLLGDVPATARERVLSEILESIGQGVTSSDEPIPPWLDVLRKRTHRRRPYAALAEPAAPVPVHSRPTTP